MPNHTLSDIAVAVLPTIVSKTPNHHLEAVQKKMCEDAFNIAEAFKKEADKRNRAT